MVKLRFPHFKVFFLKKSKFFLGLKISFFYPIISGNIINGIIPAMNMSIVPIAVSTFFLSITPLIMLNTPKNPNIIGIICEKINIPVAIVSLVLFSFIIFCLF